MLKKVKIISAIITIILPFIFHFVYKILPNAFTALFFPINESIGEHFKLFSLAAIIAFIVEMFILKKEKSCIKNNYLALLIEIISSIGLFMLIFSPIYFFIGDNIFLTIVIMILSIIASKYLGYLLIKEKHELLLNFISLIGIILIIILQIVFTFYPPNNSLFIDQTTGESGYQKNNN
ncbi:MAG: hypothetical protein IJB71_04505 [Bacilli bacterium]|nr:hypothetical protein [Bacilli bacterium]